MSIEQTKNLIDKEMCEMTKRRFGSIITKNVLYRGIDSVDENGVIYLNAEKFLIDLPHNKFFELD